MYVEKNLDLECEKQIHYVYTTQNFELIKYVLDIWTERNLWVWWNILLLASCLCLNQIVKHVLNIWIENNLSLDWNIDGQQAIHYIFSKGNAENIHFIIDTYVKQGLSFGKNQW